MQSNTKWYFAKDEKCGKYNNKMNRIVRTMHFEAYSFLLICVFSAWADGSEVASMETENDI